MDDAVGLVVVALLLRAELDDWRLRRELRAGDRRHGRTVAMTGQVVTLLRDALAPAILRVGIEDDPRFRGAASALDALLSEVRDGSDSD